MGSEQGAGGSVPADGPSDEDMAMMARCAAELADMIEAVLGGWVERSVTAVADAWRPGASAGLVAPARDAAREAVADVGAQVRDLLESDVDLQHTGPLAVLRNAVQYPTAVLRDGGVPPVERDRFTVDAFPADVYDLSPASFADIDPRLHEPGLVWGAAKAHVVLARRRAEGLR